jgi:saccharopine dehydrogenase (NAD+, L-lysine forming)
MPRSRQARAQALTRQTNGRVIPLELDVGDLAQTVQRLDDVRLVIMCLERENTALARACLERGIHYVDISASYAVLQAIEALDPVARANNATAVLSVGLTPGLTNLLARYFADLFDSVEQIDISVLLGLGEAHGADAIRWTLANADRRIAVQTPQGAQWVESFTDLLRVSFPHNAGSHRAYRFDFADQHVLRQTLGVPHVTTRLSFDSRVVTELLALLKRTGALRHAWRIDPGWVARLAQCVRLGSDQFAVRVDVLGHKDQVPIIGSGSASGRGEAQATGVITALVAEKVYTMSVQSGIFHSEQLFRPLEILRQLPGQAIRIALDVAPARPSAAARDEIPLSFTA